MNIPPSDDFPYPQLDTPDLGKPLEMAQYLESRSVPYVFGGKDPALINGAIDNLDAITGLDCSGFAAVVMWHMTGGAINIDDQNSQGQGAWAGAQGYKPSDPDSATNMDGHLYMVMLPSSASSDGIGHVGYVRNSATAESYGGHGPGSRPWGPTSPAWGWQEHCSLWVLHLGP